MVQNTNKIYTSNHVSIITGYPGTGKSHMLNEFSKFVNEMYDTCDTIRSHKPKCYEIDDLALYSTQANYFHNKWILPDRILPYIQFVCQARPVYLFGFSANLSDIIYKLDYDFSCNVNVYVINPGPDIKFYIASSLLRDSTLNRRMLRDASEYEQYANNPFSLDYNPNGVRVESGYYFDIIDSLYAKMLAQRKGQCQTICTSYANKKELTQ